MLFRDTIQLISITTDTNDIGDPIGAETKRLVYANKKSVRQSEFYQAMANGLKPEFMFEIRTSDYMEEEYLEFETVKYKIKREFSKNGEMSELICYGLVI